MARLYIIVRNDIPSLNPGKAMAQASHASSQFVWEYYNLLKTKKISIAKEEQDKVDAWLKEAGNQGFGTTIVLEANKDQMTSLFDELVKANKQLEKSKIPTLTFMQGEVCDPTYPFTLQKEFYDILEEYSTVSSDRYCLEHFTTMYNITVDKESDNGQSYKATRSEITCSWFFVFDENVEIFKDLCDKLSIELHK